MGISSSNHFSVVLLSLLCLTSAYASRTLVENNVNEKRDDSLKKTMAVDQKCSSGGCGGGPTCPGRGPGNCPGQSPGTCPGQGSNNCPGQGSGNCPGQCQGSGNCPGQCQGSCSRCVGYSSGCVEYVPICAIPCACSQGNSGGGYAYGNEKWKKINGAHGTHARMLPANGMTTHRTNMIEAHVVKPKTIGEERIPSRNEMINEEMTSKMNTLNSEVHKEANVDMASTNGGMTHGVDMGNNGVHNKAHVMTNVEPAKPIMETNGEDGTHSLSEATNQVFPPQTESEEH